MGRIKALRWLLRRKVRQHTFSSVLASIDWASMLLLYTLQFTVILISVISDTSSETTVQTWFTLRKTYCFCFFTWIIYFSVTIPYLEAYGHQWHQVTLSTEFDPN